MIAALAKEVTLQGDIYEATEAMFLPPTASEEERLAFANTEYFIVEVSCGCCGGVLQCKVAQPEMKNPTFYCLNCREGICQSPYLPSSYEMIRELGRGGMGAVYLVRHKESGEERAVKMILPRGVLSEEMRALFLKEASIQARLDHPRVVKVHSLEEMRPGIFGIVMEYVPGSNASALLPSEAPPRGLSPALAVNLVSQALSGLAYVHAQGVVHCDIKDPNLLVASAGEEISTKLSDFGLARSYQSSGAAGPARVSTVSGTLPYIPPEQLRGEGQASPAQDLYAMGATLYRLLSGCYPHDFPEGRARLLVVMEDPIVPLSHRVPSLPKRLCQVVERALSREPEARFSSAEEMQAALREAMA